MKHGDISNELPKRIIVASDVFLTTELKVSKRFKVIPVVKANTDVNRQTLSQLYIYTTRKGVTLELASFDMNEEDLGKFMDKLDNMGTNPFRYYSSYESGIFVLELQEPTDLSILLEWDGFAVDGDKDGHLNLGYETALDALRLSPLTETEDKEIVSRFESSAAKSHPIFNSVADPFFRAEYLTGDNKKVEAGFGIFLCLALTVVAHRVVHKKHIKKLYPKGPKNIDFAFFNPFHHWGAILLIWIYLKDLGVTMR